MHASGASDSGILARFVDGKRGGNVLRPGVQLTLRVESDGGEATVLVHRSGFRLAVPARAGLRNGQTVRFTVLATTPSLLLKQADREAGGVEPPRDGRSASSDGAVSHRGTLIDRFLDAHRLFDTPGSRELARALIASGRHLTPEPIRYMSTLFALLVNRTHDGADRPDRRNRLARALVELRDRSLEISDTVTPAQVDLVGWLVDGTQRRRRDDRHDGNRPDRSRPSGVGHDLASYLRRATDTPDHPLQLFNVLATTGDVHWIVIPVGASTGAGTAETRVEGTLKLAVSRAARTVEGALLAVARGDERWRFSWRRDNGRLKLCRATAIGTAQSIPEALLARLGVTRHTDRVAVNGDDGFTIATIEDGHAGVDQYG